jgi:hypothetical protein
VLIFLSGKMDLRNILEKGDYGVLKSPNKRRMNEVKNSNLFTVWKRRREVLYVTLFL